MKSLFYASFAFATKFAQGQGTNQGDQSANLIENGSFENYARCFRPSVAWCIKTSNSFIAPWTVVGGNGEYEIDSMWGGDGVWSMDLSANQPVTIQQIVRKAVPGMRYRFSMLVNSNPCGAAELKTGTVTVMGLSSQQFSHVRSPQSWNSFTYDFTAPLSGTTIQIKSTNPYYDSCGVVIDGMKVVAINDTNNINILENGSFENYANCGGSNAPWCIQKTTDLIAPWTVASKNGEFEIDSMWRGADNGTWSMDLSPNGPASIQQVLTNAVPGTAYRIEFKLNANRCGAFPVKTGTIQVLGQPVQPFSYDTTKFSNWQTVTYNFTASTGVSILQLNSTVLDSCGPVIDAVVMRKRNVAILTEYVTSIDYSFKTEAIQVNVVSSFTSYATLTQNTEVTQHATVTNQITANAEITSTNTIHSTSKVNDYVDVTVGTATTIIEEVDITHTNTVVETSTAVVTQTDTSSITEYSTKTVIQTSTHTRTIHYDDDLQETIGDLSTFNSTVYATFYSPTVVWTTTTITDIISIVTAAFI